MLTFDDLIRRTELLARKTNDYNYDSIVRLVCVCVWVNVESRQAVTGTAFRYTVY